MHCRHAARLVFLLLSAVVSSTLFAADGVASPPQTEFPARPKVAPEHPFRGAYFMERIGAELRNERAKPYWAATELEEYAAVRRLTDFRSILHNEDVLAFYGSPLSKRMGILGVHPIPELSQRLWQDLYLVCLLPDQIPSNW